MALTAENKLWYQKSITYIMSKSNSVFFVFSDVINISRSWSRSWTQKSQSSSRPQSQKQKSQSLSLTLGLSLSPLGLGLGLRHSGLDYILSKSNSVLFAFSDVINISRSWSRSWTQKSQSRSRPRPQKQKSQSYRSWSWSQTQWYGKVDLKEIKYLHNHSTAHTNQKIWPPLVWK